MTRMKAERLEQAQSGIRLENRAQAKEHSAPTPVTSDLMTVKEAAAYLRVSVWAYHGEGAPAGRLLLGSRLAAFWRFRAPSFIVAAGASELVETIQSR